MWGFKLGWFAEKSSRKIGNGEETLFFWIDLWLEGRIMKNMYPLKGLMYVLGGIGREMVIR